MLIRKTRRVSNECIFMHELRASNAAAAVIRIMYV